MSGIDVSIIIPTFNRLWSLPKAVSSCFDSKCNIEIIVIDDGSTDGTKEWLEKESKLVVIYQPNQGKDWAVNKAIKLSKGKYIRFLDSDDWISPKSTDLLLEKANRDNLDIVFAGFKTVNNNGQVLKEINWINCDDIIAQQLGECDSSHYSAFLFKREFILDIPHRQEYNSLDDRMFMIEVVLKNPKYDFLNLPTFFHRIHTNERLQSVSFFRKLKTDYTRIELFKGVINRLDRSHLNYNRHIKACSRNIWLSIKELAKVNLKESMYIFVWLQSIDPSCNFYSKNITDQVYKFLGLFVTESIFRTFRPFRRLIINTKEFVKYFFRRTKP